MAAFKHHVLICTQDKPDGLPACSVIGGKALLEQFRASVGKAGLMEDTLVTGCGCLGLCERGPNVLIYPQGRWYTGVAPKDVDQIVEQELRAGAAVQGRDEPDEATIAAEVNEHRAKVRNMMMARGKAGALPDELHAMASGFRTSRALLTAVELDVFSAIGQGATADQVASALETDPRGTAALLHALASLGLVEKRGDAFHNGEWARTFLVQGAPHDARAALMHTVNLWDRWTSLTESVRTGAPSPAAGPRTGESLEAFIAAMHKNAALRAPMLASALGLADVRAVLDVGGGSGAYSIAMARAKADLTATVFDMPEVIVLAQRNIEQAGVGDRVRTRPGSFKTDDLGSGYDLALLSAICHMLSPDENVQLLRKVAAALAPGGRAVIQDFILNDDGTGHATATLFALNMLVNTKGGGSYSAKQYGEWLQAAGFTDIKPMKLPGPTGLMVGKKA